MKLVTAEEMRRIDKDAQETYGLPELLLMENAGRAAALSASRMMAGNVRGRQIVLVAGSGNNGGDAFSAARYLMGDGARVKVFLAGERGHLKASPEVMLHAIEAMGAQVFPLEDDRDFDRFHVALRFSELIVDGVLGTGFSGELRKKTLRIIELMNAAAAPKLAIDIASGVEADTGRVPSVAVQAQESITFGAPKPGQYLGRGHEATGALYVDTIGLPPMLLEKEEIRQTVLDDALAASLLPQRAWDAYKGSVGKFLVVAGSRGMTGAAALSSMAALRIGAGLVTLAVPESLNAAFEQKVTEVMTLPLPDPEGGKAGISGGLSAMELLNQKAQDADAVLLGPGLGRAPETMELVRCVAQKADCPVVLDADAIYAYHGRADELRELKHTPVLTPHLGEMAVLLGVSIEVLKENLLETVRKAAREYLAVFVVKSEETIVVRPDGEAFFATTGNPGMATAGCGDVLAGTILGLMHEAGDAAPLLGLHLHGLAGDLSYEEKGEGLLASDILEHLPHVRKALKEKNEKLS